MAEKIVVVDNTIEEITIEEFSGAPTGTIITSTHGMDKGNQHTIRDIIGLKETLHNIEKLHQVRSNLGGHADYYQWGEEATADNPLGPGYFVRLGADGKIHKCTNETIVLRPTDLALDTNENGEAIIYAFAGNITTADINKYYVVGTQAPYDIYAYDGVEYVQKSAYSYDGEQVIKTCHTTDMLGVTVSSAGFVGNDANITETYTSAKATDTSKYVLVATTGVVDVLCDHSVLVGDYVFPTVGGWAAKSTGSYGYLVTALVQNGVVVQQINKEEMLYAQIVLSQSIVNTKKVSDNVDYLLAETKRLDENITTFGNTAEAALKRAEELTEGAQQVANESQQIAQDATNAAVNAQNSANKAWGVTEQAQQAAKDAQAAQEAALTLKDEAIAGANEVAAQIATDKFNETLNTVRALEYRLDEYTVGQYSQAYGLTFAQAKAILPLGTSFIPMDEDCTEGKLYEEIYANEEAGIKQVFTVGRAYIWTNSGWLEDSTVLITRTPTDRNDGDYWFVTEDYDDTEYKRGALYRWESGKWVEKAIRVENTMSRTIAHLYHEDDTIRQSVTSVEGKVAAVETKVTETDARVGLVASVPTGIQAKPGNYNEEKEALDIIADKTTLDADWAEMAVVGKYYVVGNKLPYEVYEWNGSEFIPKDTVTYDGVNLYKANIASIFTTANEEGSNVSLNADRINFISKAFNIFASDGDGNIIKDTDGNPVVNFTVDNTGNVGVKGKITATEGQIGNLTVGTDGSLTCQKAQINEEGMETTITTFQLDAEGNAVFEGRVEATSGSIGGCEIIDGNLMVKSANIDSLEASKVMVTGTKSVATVIENTLIDSKIYYALSDSVTIEPIQDLAKPETVWSTTAPAYQEKMYMWQKIVNTYNCAPAEGEESDENGNKVVTNITCIAGASGKGVEDVTSYYLASNMSEGVTMETEGWTPSIQYVSQDKKFLWKYEEFKYTDGDSKPTTPCVVGMFGESVTYKYYLSNLNTPPEYQDTNDDNIINAEDGWYDAPQGVSKDKPYEYVVQVMGTSTTIPTLWAKYGFDGGVLQEITQYLISDSMTSAPSALDEGWNDDFPTYHKDGGDHIWTGQNYVWKKTVTTHDDSGEEVQIVLLPTMEVATIMAEKDGQELSDWCADKDITLIDGASIATKSIRAGKLAVEELSAINGNVGTLEAGVIKSTNDNFQISLTEGTIDSEHFKLKANGDVSITGHIEAKSGDIGGWKISDDPSMLYAMTDSGASKFGIGMAPNPKNAPTDPAFWAGYSGQGNHPWQDSMDWRRNTNFYATNEGKLYAQGGQIGPLGFIDQTRFFTTYVYLAHYSVKFDDNEMKRYVEIEVKNCTTNKYEHYVCYVEGASLTHTNDMYIWSGKFQLKDLSGNIGYEWEFNDRTAIEVDIDKYPVLSFTGTCSYSQDMQSGEEEYKFSGAVGNVPQSPGILQIGNGLYLSKLKIHYNNTSISFAEDCGILAGTWKLDTGSVITSDRNLKHAIESLGEEYSKLFDNLTPTRFKYNDGTSDRYHTGLIAQDLEQAILNAGLTNDDMAAFVRDSNGQCGIRYEELIALNIYEIQKLKKRVAELENQTKGENNGTETTSDHS